MTWYIPSAILATLSVGYLVLLCVRKYPQVRLVNPSVIPEEKTRKLKEQIVLDRLSRLTKTKMGGWVTVVKSLGHGISRAGRKAVRHVYSIEQYYARIQKAKEHKGHTLDEAQAHTLLEEAEDLMRSGEVLAAEKRCIEVISHLPKLVEAYETLGAIYLNSKQYASAKETLMYASRIDPKNATVLVLLGTLDDVQGNHEAAFVHFEKAVELFPSNPKFLDAYVESALEAKKITEAQKGIERMKEVNIENSKIPLWEERVRELEKKTETT